MQGLQTARTNGSVAETMAALEAALNKNEMISIVAQVDHQANAGKAGLDLRPTRLTIFGNPNLGTQLMQINQLAGLDLPQKIFAWEDETGQSNIAYNSAEYLSGRHGLSEADGELAKINNALVNLASAAAGQTASPDAVTVPGLKEGIIVVQSANDMDTTTSKLRQAIESAEPLQLMAEVNHSENGSSVNMDLDPTHLFIFGNPKLGTPLMQSGQTIGIDLPQKMLVFRDSNGAVSIAYDDPAYLIKRHGIEGQDTVAATISTALANLAGAAGTQ